MDGKEDMMTDMAALRIQFWLLACVIFVTACARRHDQPAANNGNKNPNQTQQDADFEIVRPFADADPAEVHRRLTPLLDSYKPIVPFKMNMTTGEIEQIVNTPSNEKNNGKEKSEAMVLDKQIVNGNGHFSLLLRGAGDCWVDLSINNDRVGNIWLMIGGMEINTGMYHRIEGAGPRRGVLKPLKKNGDRDDLHHD
jgi:hypothetical protein